MVSGFFPNLVVSDLRPAVQITNWDQKFPTPSGIRHIESGVYVASAKLGQVGGFVAQNSTISLLDFGDIVVTNNSYQTDTKVLTVNIGEINSNPGSLFNNASGVDDKFKIFNIRLWMPNKSAFNNLNSAEFYYFTSESWRDNFKLTPTTTGVKIIPSSLPETFNIKVRQDQFASGALGDLEYSHFIYLIGSFSGFQSNTLGAYGAAGSGDFQLRFTYDWSSLPATILTKDSLECIAFSGLAG